MPKPDIRGLKHYDPVAKVPEQVASGHRRTKYDQVISDARRKPVRLVFESEDIATNVYVALRARMKRDHETLQVKKRGPEVYVFAPASIRPASMKIGGLSQGKKVTGLKVSR
jgi:hypothetical protein